MLCSDYLDGFLSARSAQAGNLHRLHQTFGNRNIYLIVINNQDLCSGSGKVDGVCL